jgi:probable rRNA maturation factor
MQIQHSAHFTADCGFFSKRPDKLHVATDPQNDGTARSQVEVLIDEIPGLEVADHLVELVKLAAETALDAEHSTGPDAVTVLISNDTRLKELNLEFNGEDAVTDVLSFNDVEGWHNGVPPERLERDLEFLAPGEIARLGEIVISLEQTARQAANRSIPLERELAMLTIHGVLHLLGYDHADAEEERVMFGKTDAVLAVLNL